MSEGQFFPRPLSRQETDLLFGILPENRLSYNRYRDIIARMVVIGEGRRGAGEFILGKTGDIPNFDEPLAPVFAYGAIETSTGTISITLREISLEQISIEIVNSRSEAIPEGFEESRRWTYSTWQAGIPCPQCQTPVREVTARTNAGEIFIIAICKNDKRIWVYQEEEQLVRLIPITNFYNELMLNKNIRDPKIALDSKQFFSSLQSYTDADIIQAFQSYNKLKTKVQIRGEIHITKQQQSGLISRLKTIFSSKQQ